MAYRTKFTPPLSPFLTIFRWPVSMMTSIAHRITGVGLAGGLLVLAWWLFAVATGPESYAFLYRQADSVVGQILLFGFVWAFAYHFLNGVRHLAWDFGFGLSLKSAGRSGVAVVVASLALAVLVFVAVHFGLGGYYDEP